MTRSYVINMLLLVITDDKRLTITLTVEKVDDKMAADTQYTKAQMGRSTQITVRNCHLRNNIECVLSASVECKQYDHSQENLKFETHYSRTPATVNRIF